MMKMYEIGKPVQRVMVRDIAASFSVITAILNAYGTADLETLSIATAQHDRPSKGRGFVLYCERRGWIREVV